MRLISFNTGLFAITVAGKHVRSMVPFVPERLEKQLQEIPKLGADVLGVQELFHKHVQSRYKTALAQHFPYSYVPKNISPFRFSNGLGLFSKYPLHNTYFRTFRAAQNIEKFACFGFVDAVVEYPKQPFRVINVHMSVGGIKTKSDEGVAKEIRERQLEQIFHHLHYYPTDDIPTVLMGDFNAGPQASGELMKSLVKEGYYDPGVHITNRKRFLTWDNQNPLVSKGQYDRQDAQLDHIFVCNQFAERIKGYKIGRVFDDPCVDTPWGEIPLSDHYGLFCDLEMKAAYAHVPITAKKKLPLSPHIYSGTPALIS